MDFAEMMRGYLGGQPATAPPDTGDYAAALRPMIDPLAGRRSVGEMPSTQEGVKAFGRSAAEPFGQLGRLMTGQSQDTLADIVGAAAAMVPIGPPGAAKVLGKLAKPAAEAAEAAATGGLGDFIKAYHGSPHDFERFDLSKIGTGEGAQAFGHGLYFAENEGVAKGYRDQLAKSMYYTPGGQIFDPQSQLQHLNVRAMAHNNGTNLDATIARAKDLLTRASDQTRPMLEHDIGVLQSFKDAGGIAKGPGKMYQVAIKAPPEHFLDWDKPLSEQSPKVREALEPFRQAVIKDRQTNNPSLGDVTHTAEVIAGAPDQAAMSKALREAGIPGIKYLDQSSRAPVGPQTQLVSDRSGQWYVADQAGKRQYGPFQRVDDARSKKSEVDAQAAAEYDAKNKTRNYVVFDDKLIDILKKYGIAGIGALPAMNAYHYRDEQ